VDLLELVQLLLGDSAFAVVLGVPEQEGADGVPEVSIWVLHCFNYNAKI
jgi:hypothetical protein